MKLDNKAVSFDDVLLIPKTSILKSRSEAKLGVNFLGFDIDIPVMSANMESITGEKMAIAMYNYGGVGVLNRFLPFEEQIDFCKNVKFKPKIVSIGLNFENACKLIDAGADIICLDIAHADSIQTHEFVYNFLEKYPNFPLIVGNYADPYAAFALKTECKEYWHDNIVFKVGIGGGSMCSTRIVTGFGVPTLQSLLWFRSYPDLKVIADGGIKNTGDMAKCFAAGAKMIMCGSMFAGCDETPGLMDGRGYKHYYGSASYIQKKNRKNVEGVDTLVEVKGPVQEILESIKDGLQSAISYGGGSHIYDLAYCSMVEISSSGYRESLPHGSQC